MWKYYDFDVNWNTFIKVWNSDTVQHAMEIDMTQWKEIGFFKFYIPGNPLWKETRTTYWTIKLTEQALNKIHNNNYINKIKKIDNCMFRHHTNKLYRKIIFKHVIEECEPKQDTIDSLYMPEGFMIFKMAMRTCAYELFPNEIIRCLYNKNKWCILIPRLEIVFDLFSYYSWKYDNNCNACIIQEDIDKLLN